MSTKPAEVRPLRPPPIQTGSFRPQTAPSNGTPTSPNFDSNKGKAPPLHRSQNSMSNDLRMAPSNTQPGQQRFVLTDPVAFRYLEEDPATTVLERKQVLNGYECYVVEQWATSRSHPTFTITTYTGDASSMVLVDVLSVPTDESTWSPRLRVYFKALNQYHARRRETPLGILMVTNLSGFPSSLTVISVPDGDLRKHRNDFFVNENLKRLNCTGRVGLSLDAPGGATVAKFHQLYRTSEKNEIYDSVIELVKLCQSALLLFDKLEVDYADGLLCDVTERAITDWWVEMGSQYYNIEPHDGILGPTTVAGLLGLLMGARNRLHAVSAPVAKDPFDIESMKKGISAFQKQQRVPRTRRLDRRTLERLHRATQKAASHEGWTVPKAVKSTVAELSGKGGDRVMDVVQRKDRASIAEIETCDMDRFVQLVYGERAKWLWYGRPLKTKAAKMTVGAPTRVGEEKLGIDGRTLNFREDEHGGFTWAARKSVGDALVAGKREEDGSINAMTGEPSASEDGERKGLLKRTTGLGRIAGAVGLGHHQRHTSKDVAPPQTPTGEAAKRSFEFLRTPQSPAVSPRQSMDESPRSPQMKRPGLQRAHSTPISSPEASRPSMQGHRPTWKETIPEKDVAPAYAASYREMRSVRSRESFRPPSYNVLEKSNEMSEGGEQDTISHRGSDAAALVDASVGDFAEQEAEIRDDASQTWAEPEQSGERLLQRTVSESQLIMVNHDLHATEIYPRHLSFSLAEDSVLTWPSVAQHEADSYFEDPGEQLADEAFTAAESKNLQRMIRLLSASTAVFTQTQLETLHTLLAKLDADQRAVDDLHQPLVNQFEALRAGSAGVLRAERERLEESGKEIETLVAKLDYEIDGLKGKIEDVQLGVGEFEKNVGRVEERVRELEKDEAKAEKGWGCVVS